MSEEDLTVLDKALTLHTKYNGLIIAVYGLVKFSALMILFFWTGLFADAASYTGELHPFADTHPPADVFPHNRRPWHHFLLQ